ncbi:unannotated protein [freshwater metagenome]|uniref:Unannotated protein n=1 Tax=freshwater metagenome TaxID=449393 RepID=A0A6J7JVJ2_9ZZZZ
MFPLAVRAGSAIPLNNVHATVAIADFAHRYNHLHRQPNLN